MSNVQALLLRPHECLRTFLGNLQNPIKSRAISGPSCSRVSPILLHYRGAGCSRQCSLANDWAGPHLHIPSVMPSKVADLEASTTSRASLAPFESDYARQQHQKQLKNNYHSSSLAMMFPKNVNRTSLHPGGVEYVSLQILPRPRRCNQEAIANIRYRPQREHTEIEEELHEVAHIDYDRVSIVSGR